MTRAEKIKLVLETNTKGKEHTRFMKFINNISETSRTLESHKTTDQEAPVLPEEKALCLTYIGDLTASALYNKDCFHPGTGDESGDPDCINKINDYIDQIRELIGMEKLSMSPKKAITETCVEGVYCPASKLAKCVIFQGKNTILLTVPLILERPKQIYKNNHEY